MTQKFKIGDACIIELQDYPYGFWWGEVSQINEIEFEFPKRIHIEVKAKVNGGKFRVDERSNPIFNPKENDNVIGAEIKSQTVFDMNEQTISLIARLHKLVNEKAEWQSKYRWLEDLHIRSKKE